MIPTKFEDLKVGMVWEHVTTKNTITLEAITSLNTIILKHSITGYKAHHPSFIFNNAPFWVYQEKPLDKALKSLSEVYGQINPHIPKTCKHLNIMEDKWFTSKIYKHCKDCGVAL